VTYSDSVRFLYSLGNELKVGAKFGLERMQTLLAELGNPERSQRFVHVAGTNGKGSTCAMIANALHQAGFRTGLYTSPHLIEPTERIQIGDKVITPEDFAQAFETVHAAAEALLSAERLDAHPSYFETVTAMALVTFRERCDVSVLEVGLGGRLDATNVVNPKLCVITPVAFDHESFLGNTLESIAREKAGILKPGVPLVFASQLAPAKAVITKRARELGCDIISASEATLSEIEVTPDGSTFSLDGINYRCALRGRHQIENAVTAILACRRLGVEVPAIQAGLNSVQWPGRLELLSRNPDFVLDGAHNPAGATALAAYVREFCSHRPVWLVYGAMRDKAIEEVTAQLFPLADRLILTAPDFPRALRPEAILEVSSHPNVSIAPAISEAIHLARKAPSEAIVFFSGSLFLVGETRALLLGQRPSVS
jgi:dihydrofolate synthase/folylpolyglutamate synthase